MAHDAQSAAVFQQVHPNLVDEVVKEFLYVGCRSANTPLYRKSLGFTHVIQVSSRERDDPANPPIQQQDLFIQLMDDEEADLLSHAVPAVIQYLDRLRYSNSDGDDEEHRADVRVLLHCDAGVSRSVSLAIAYMMYDSVKTCNSGSTDSVASGMVPFSYRRILQLIQSCRPIAQPNEGFAQQLEKYEQILINTWQGRKEGKKN